MTRTVVQELRIVQIVALRQSEGKRKKEKGKNRDCDYASYHLESSLFFLTFTFLLVPRSVVTRGRFPLPHFLNVAIYAGLRLVLVLVKLFFDGRKVLISLQFHLIVVTRSA